MRAHLFPELIFGQGYGLLYEILTRLAGERHVREPAAQAQVKRKDSVDKIM